MNAVQLLEEIQRRGVTVTVRDGAIIAKPIKAVPPELRAAAAEMRAELLALLKREGEIARIAALDAERNAADKAAGRGYDNDPTAPSYTGPAKSLVRICLEYGVNLRLEADGTIVVGPGAWRTLVNAIEQHVDAVARLLQQGWSAHDA